MTKTASRHIAVALGIAAVCLPAAFILTFLLMPLWSWIEATYKIESVGHSGPADWCFWAVYALIAVPSLSVYAVKAARK
jgi:hypothetical protein